MNSRIALGNQNNIEFYVEQITLNQFTYDIVNNGADVKLEGTIGTKTVSVIIDRIKFCLIADKIREREDDRSQ